MFTVCIAWMTGAAAGEGPTVVRVTPGEAVVDAELPIGVELRFFGPRERGVPSLTADGREARTVEEPVGSGRVTYVEEGRSLVELTRGSAVVVGDWGQEEPDAARYPLAPPRPTYGLGEFGVVVRPILGLGTIGGAMVGDVWLSYGGPGPWYVRLTASPVGGGGSREGTVGAAAAAVSGGYEGRFLTVGVGAGFAALSPDGF